MIIDFRNQVTEFKEQLLNRVANMCITTKYFIGNIEYSKYVKIFIVVQNAIDLIRVCVTKNKYNYFNVNK